MMRSRLMIAAAVTMLFGAAAVGMAEPAEQARNDVTSTAKAFPADDGVIDLMVSGPAALALYDRLPGEGEGEEKNGCGATGLHKGSGRIRCVKREQEYSCHIWLDVPKETLAEPEIDDC